MKENKDGTHIGELLLATFTPRFCKELYERGAIKMNNCNYKYNLPGVGKFCHKYYETECKLHNLWISGESHPTDVTKDYLLEYEDGSHIVAMWDSGMWMSKDLHPLKNPKKWMPITELKKGE